MKTVAIIQARMGSTRLPGKILKDLMGKTVLQHVIERVRMVNSIDEVIIATTILDQDNVVVHEANKCGVKFFRGSEEDVLSRYYLAAKESEADVIVRITSDCPLIDPIITNKVVKYFLEKQEYELVTNAGIDVTKRTFPRGLDTEVFSFQALEEAFRETTLPYQREHVTPYIYENSNKIYFYQNEVDYSHLRWTLDTEEDYLLIEEIYTHLYHGTHNFYFQDILQLLDKYPELIQINSHIEQKKIY